MGYRSTKGLAMYPECRHILPGGRRCRAAVLKQTHWCYFHNRLHRHEDRRKHELRHANGRFAPSPHPGGPATEAGQQSGTALSPNGSPRERSEGPALPAETTLDHGLYPVPASPVPQQQDHQTGALSRSLRIPAVEDNAAIQLALIEVLHALAANHLDPRRAGLLLYGLQVASANARHLSIGGDEVRSLTYAANGSPLARPEQGFDIEDMQADDEEDED